MKLFIPLAFILMHFHAFAQLNANFTANLQSGCSPFMVQFTDQSTGNPTSWKWDFGNGRTSNQQNPLIVFTTPGVFTVQLTIGIGNTTNTVTKNGFITVFDNPEVRFSVSEKILCTPAQVQFTDLTTGPSPLTRWQWDFGDGSNKSLDQNPSYTYTKGGRFNVTLKVFDENGCSQSFTQESLIIANDITTSSFNYSINTACSYPATVTFNNTSIEADGLSYSWTFGDGTSSIQKNPVHTYNLPGYYRVELQTTNSTNTVCRNVSEQYISIAPPVADFILPTSFCANASLQFVDNSAPFAKQASWDFGDGSKGNGLSVRHVYKNPGTYTITQTAEFGGCTAVTSKTIVVAASPVTAFSTSGSLMSCNSTNINFTNQSTGASSYQWIFGDGTTSTDASTSHSYANAGTYDVSLVAFANGCYDTLTKQNLVQLSTFRIDSIIPLQVTGCAPQTVQFGAIATNREAISSYQWAFGDGATSTAPQPSHTYTQPGGYTIQLTATNASGCKDTFAYANGVALGVAPIPDFSTDSVDACASSLIPFKDLSQGAVTDRIWDFRDKTKSSEKNPLHQFEDTGYFNVKLTVYSNGCADSITKRQVVHIKAPIAQFDIAKNCENNFEFTFPNTSIGRGQSVWDFGDGSTSQNSSPVHTYQDTGVFRVRLTETNNECSYTTDSIVYVYPTPDIIHDPEQEYYCKYDSIKFFIPTYNRDYIYQYNWIFGDGIQTGFDRNDVDISKYYQYLKSGQFNDTLIIQDAYGCLDTATDDKPVYITGPTASFTSDLGICLGATNTFNDLSTSFGSPIKKWVWDFGDGTRDSLAKGSVTHIYQDTGFFTVQLNLTDSLGCRDSLIRYNAFQVQALNLALTNDTTICSGDKAVLTASGGDTYLWSPATTLSCDTCGAVTASPPTTTTYQLTAAKGDVCVITDSVKVTVQPPVNIVATVPDAACVGTPLTLTATGADVFKWVPLPPSTGPSLDGATVTINPDSDVVYQIIGYDSSGCSSDTGLVRVKVKPRPDIIFQEPEVEMLSGSTYNLFPMLTSDVVRVIWTPDSALSCTNCRYPRAKPTNTITYKAVAENGGGCTDSANITVKVLCNENNLFVPNTFSPNNDGANDRFTVRGTGLLTVKSFNVFNRWGVRVYEETDVRPNGASAGWNGMYRGEKQPTGVYVYMIEVQCSNQQVITVKGNVTLLR